MGVCMYKMVVEITKEKWGKCGIKTLIYHNKEKKKFELWQKMTDSEIQIGHSNIADVVLKVVSATFMLVYFLSLNKSTCQTRKNVFHFTSKALFVLEKIKF